MRSFAWVATLILLGTVALTGCTERPVAVDVGDLKAQLSKWEARASENATRAQDALKEVAKLRELTQYGVIDARTCNLTLLVEGNPQPKLNYLRWRLTTLDDSPNERLLDSALEQMTIATIDAQTWTATGDVAQGVTSLALLDPANPGVFAAPRSAVVYLNLNGTRVAHHEAVWTPQTDEYHVRNATGGWESARADGVLTLPFDNVPCVLARKVP